MRLCYIPLLLPLLVTSGNRKTTTVVIISLHLASFPNYVTRNRRPKSASSVCKIQGRINIRRHNHVISRDSRQPAFRHTLQIHVASDCALRHVKRSTLSKALLSLSSSQRVTLTDKLAHHFNTPTGYLTNPLLCLTAKEILYHAISLWSAVQTSPRQAPQIGIDFLQPIRPYLIERIKRCHSSSSHTRFTYRSSASARRRSGSHRPRERSYWP
jgi:hypothetical protein